MFFRFLLLILVFASFSRSFAQGNLALHPWQVDTLIVPDNPITTYHFPGNHRVIDQSIKVYINQRELEYPVEYRFNSDQNLLSFYAEINKADSLHISYQILPVLLQRQYSFFQLDTSISVLDS